METNLSFGQLVSHMRKIAGSYGRLFALSTIENIAELAESHAKVIEANEEILIKYWGLKYSGGILQDEEYFDSFYDTIDEVYYISWTPERQWSIHELT